jgi:epoxide hydrolase 4
MRIWLSILLLASWSVDTAHGQDVWNQVEHVYADSKRADSKGADSKDVKIHYAALGKGPLVVMIHGFPDFWYTWRKQMRALVDNDYRVAAVDLRGYNLSDQPAGVENYAMALLVEDIAAVIAKEQAKSAIVVGHDWGGAIAWTLAMRRPELVELLVICNVPHPAGIAHELATNPQQRKNSSYAFNLQQPDVHKTMSAEALASWVTDATALPRYLDALNESSFESMTNYYKANYPRADAPQTPAVEFPKVKVPVLMFHGLKDQALLPGGLNNTWEWVAKDLTIVTLPEAGHFVQQDAAEQVSNTLIDWLKRRRQ